jgi:ABC-type glycerol-3-phosphate transport system substrate-binding protein
MIRRTMVVGLLALIVVLAACSGGQAETTAGVSDAAQATPRGFFGAGGEPPLSMKLPVGTLMLEDTPLAVTPAQAQELLPLWQMLRALQGSGTSSQVEIEAVYDQIQETMTPEQLAAMEEMSQEDMRALFEELGMERQGDDESEEGETRGFGRPDAGMMPMPEGGGEGMMIGPGGPGGFGELSAEERATAMAGRAGGGMGFGTGMIDAVIELLEERAAEA